jgi:hypothetical protein
MSGMVMWCCRDVCGLCVHVCDVAGSTMYIHNLNFVFKCVWPMCLDLCGLWISFSVYVNSGLRFRSINFCYYSVIYMLIM